MSPRFLLCAICPLLISAPAASAATVGYYRFEDLTNDRIPSPANRPTVIDSSGRGLDLYAFKNPALASSVPAGVIPQTQAPNTRSLHVTGTEDLYAKPDEGLSRVVFTDFTIEAWVRFESMVGTQTIVGRDSFSRDQGAGALFYLSKTTHSKPGLGQKENAFRVELATRSDRCLTIEGDLLALPETWHHVAVVGNTSAGSLSLYVDGRLAGTATDFDGLFVPPANSGWSIARGQYGGKVTDRLFGWIDEVRFSDTALKSAQFLNSAPPPATSSAPGAKPVSGR